MDVLDSLQPGPIAPSDQLLYSEYPYNMELLHVEHISRWGLCGNGLCERGERCNSEGKSASLNGQPCCFKDCPYVSSSCEGQTFGYSAESPCSGNGVCLDSSGQCSCFEGYTGVDCSECLLGWISVGNGSCVKVPDSKTLARLALAYTGKALHPSIIEEFAPNKSDIELLSHTRRKSSMGVKAAILASSLGIVIMGVSALFFLLFLKKRPVVIPTAPMRSIEIPGTHKGDGDSGGSPSKQPGWRTSFLGLQTDFEIIPITPMVKKKPFDHLPPITDENDGGPTISRKSIIFKVGPHSPQMHSEKLSNLSTDEDLTEEEQSQFFRKVKKGLKRGQSAHFVTDYLTDSGSDSEIEDLDSETKPQLAFVLDSPTTAITPRNKYPHVQYSP